MAEAKQAYHKQATPTEVIAPLNSERKLSAIELAQRTANREGKAMAVLNLNSFSPLYVVRDWRDGFANYSGLAGYGELVARIDPIQRPKLSEEGAKIISISLASEEGG